MRIQVVMSILRKSCMMHNLAIVSGLLKILYIVYNIVKFDLSQSLAVLLTPVVVPNVGTSNTHCVLACPQGHQVSTADSVRLLTLGEARTLQLALY